MIKNILPEKLERAFKGKATSYSKSGSTVGDIKSLVNEKLRSSNYDTIAFHVGTNDLTKDDVKTVTENLQSLILDVKRRVRNAAFSDVIKRYDGKVTDKVISDLNYRICKRFVPSAERKHQKS